MLLIALLGAAAIVYRGPFVASAALRLADTRAGRRALQLAAALVVGFALSAAAALTLLSSTASLLAPPMTEAPSGTAVAEIPSAYLPLYLAAARTYAIPWNVLAAIGGSNPATAATPPPPPRGRLGRCSSCPPPSPPTG